MKSLFKTKFLALLMSFCFIVGLAPAMSVHAASATASPSPTAAPVLEDKTISFTCWPYLDANNRSGTNWVIECDYYSFVRTFVYTFHITSTGETEVYYYPYVFSKKISSISYRTYYPLTGVYDAFKYKNLSNQTVRRSKTLDGVTFYYSDLDGSHYTGSADTLNGFPNPQFITLSVSTLADAEKQVTSLNSQYVNESLTDLLLLYSGFSDWDDVFPPSGSGTDAPNHSGGGSGHGGNSDGYVDDAFDDDDTDYGILNPIVKWFKAIVSTLVSIPTKILNAFTESDFGKKILEYLSYLTSIPSNIWNAFTETEIGKKYLEFTDKMVSFYDWYFDKFEQSPFGSYIVGIYDYFTNLHTNLEEAFSKGSFFQTVKAIPTAITDAMKDAFPFLSDIEDRFKQSLVGRCIYGMWSAVSDIYDYMTEEFEDGNFWDAVRSIPGKILGLPSAISDALHDKFPILSDIEETFKSSPLGRLLYSYGDFYSGIYDYLTEGFQDGSFWDAVKGLPDKIKGLPSEIAEKFKEFLPDFFSTWDGYFESLSGFFEFIDDNVIVTFDDIRSHYDDLMSVPFLASIRSSIDIIHSHMNSWGKEAPVIKIPLSSSFLSAYGVQDMVLDFSWFDNYRSTVLTVESAFLIVIFAFRAYFDVKNLLNGAGGAVSSIHSIID